MFRTKSHLVLWLLAGLITLPACREPVRARARVGTLNILSAAKQGAKFKINLSGVPKGVVCSVQGGLKDFCVTKFRDAVERGLKLVLLNHFDPAKPGPSYVASFKLLSFSHSNTSDHVIKITLRWQFTITDASGYPVVRLAETTDGPEQLSDVTAAGDAVATLLGAVMEKISAEIGKSAWDSEHPAVTTTTAPLSSSNAPDVPPGDTIPPNETVD